jgi:hypothetical protein
VSHRQPESSSIKRRNWYDHSTGNISHAKMNCPIRTDPAPDEGHNQNPPDLAREITTNNTLNHRRNSTVVRKTPIDLDGSHDLKEEVEARDTGEPRLHAGEKTGAASSRELADVLGSRGGGGEGGRGGSKDLKGRLANGFHKLKKGALKYLKFMGPGFMVSVAYIDPGTCLPFSPILVEYKLIECVNRKLRNRRCSRGDIPLPSPLHDTALQRLRHIPPVPVHQARHGDGHESRGELQGSPPPVA